ncbi:hypothetical protein HK099_001814, partial [Clydaea vesicula]
VAVGHPFDTIKTKMQAEPGFNNGMVKSFQQVWNSQGVKGLYKGSLGPILGSGLYRSTQFAVFEALYTKWDNQFMKKEIPYTFGLQNRVVLAGFAASTARALIECPIEYAKVCRQTGQNWNFNQIFKGFHWQWVRTSGVMVWYFCAIDSIRRNHPEVFSSPSGQFLASSTVATLGFWIVWPTEVLKNQVQAGTKIKGKTSAISTMDRLNDLMKNHGGIRGLYRGILPGTYRSFFANGFSIVVMIWAQKQATALGFRG